MNLHAYTHINILKLVETHSFRWDTLQFRIPKASVLLNYNIVEKHRISVRKYIIEQKLLDG